MQNALCQVKHGFTAAECLLLLGHCRLQCRPALNALSSAGKMVYHGPREHILPFFGSQGMHCPPRKADSDFLQEVTSRRNQQVNPMSPFASHTVIHSPE